MLRILIRFSGGYCGGVTPDPIPNSEVKPSCADGTAGETLWESRSLPDLWAGSPLRDFRPFFYGRIKGESLRDSPFFRWFEGTRSLVAPPKTQAGFAQRWKSSKSHSVESRGFDDTPPQGRSQAPGRSSKRSATRRSPDRRPGVGRGLREHDPSRGTAPRPKALEPGGDTTSPRGCGSRSP